MKLSTTSLATETKTITFKQLREMMVELANEYGREATAKDLFNLHKQSSNCIYEKLLFVISGPSPIHAVSVTKLGPTYTLQACKSTWVEYTGQKCTTIINLVLDHVVSPEDVILEKLKDNNLDRVHQAIEKAEFNKGKNATVGDVFKILRPNVRLGVGRLCHRTPKYDIYFNGFLGNIIVEIIDLNGFKKTITSAGELKTIILS